MNTVSAPLPLDPWSVPARLGYLGLIPFVIGAALVWIVRADVHAYVALALSTYAALILSFLGAIHSYRPLAVGRGAGLGGVACGGDAAGCGPGDSWADVDGLLCG